MNSHAIVVLSASGRTPLTVLVSVLTGSQSAWHSTEGPGLTSLLRINQTPYVRGQAGEEAHRGRRRTADRTSPALVHPASGARRGHSRTAGARRRADPPTQGQRAGRQCATAGARLERERVPASTLDAAARMADCGGRAGRVGG